MRIAIDATPLLVRSAGIKNYVYYWVTALQAAAHPGTIVTLPPLGELGPLDHDASMAEYRRTWLSLLALGLSNKFKLPIFEILAARADIVHISTLMRNPPRRPKLTATIYDMTCMLMPEVHEAANIAANREYGALMQRAAGLISISESSKNDAVRLLGLDPERIDVIYPGIPERYFSIDPAEVERVRTRYELTRPFVLSVGTIEPRKNVPALIQAFAALPPAVRDEADLVLAGPSGWADEDTHGMVRKVRYLGYVPEADLAPLTAAAAVFAYPSLYEGFGFPVAQAMAAGVPVVTSNVSSLPEIAGDAALLIDPRSQAELTAALDRLLVSADLRAKLGDCGRERARRFQWADCAVKSMRFFERIAG